MTVKQTIRKSNNVLVTAEEPAGGAAPPSSSSSSSSSSCRLAAPPAAPDVGASTCTTASKKKEKTSSPRGGSSSSINHKKAWHYPQRAEQQKKTIMFKQTATHPVGAAAGDSSNSKKRMNKNQQQQQQQTSFSSSSLLAENIIVADTTDAQKSSLSSSTRILTSTTPPPRTKERCIPDAVSSTSTPVPDSVPRHDRSIKVIEHRDTSPNDNRDESTGRSALHRNNVTTSSTSTSGLEDHDDKSTKNNKKQYTNGDHSKNVRTDTARVRKTSTTAAAVSTMKNSFDLDHNKENSNNHLVDKNNDTNTTTGMKQKVDGHMSPHQQEQGKQVKESHHRHNSLLDPQKSDKSQSAVLASNSCSTSQEERELPQSSSEGAVPVHKNVAFGSSTSQIRPRGSSKGAFRYPAPRSNTYHRPQASSCHHSVGGVGANIAANDIDAKSFQQGKNNSIVSNQHDQQTNHDHRLQQVSRRQQQEERINNYGRPNNKSYSYSTTKRGNKYYSRGAAAGGGRHYPNKYRYHMSGRESNQETKVQETGEKELLQAESSISVPLKKEQSTFVVESSTQTEQVASEEQQVSLQQEQEGTQQVVTSNAAGLALLHRLSQGVPPQEEERNVRIVDDKEKDSTLPTSKSWEQEKSKESKKMTEKEDDNREKKETAQTVQKESMSNHGDEATKECEAHNALTEEEEVANTNVLENPLQYPQPWMVFPIMMAASNDYPPHQEFFCSPAQPQQQSPAIPQQPMVFVSTAPAPYNDEYTMAPPMLYGYPPMAYSGYSNPESGAYEEYLHPMDTAAAIHDNGAAPLKYEQVMVGGTVYFNPVYAGDYQNFETSDGMYQEYCEDEEQQEQVYYAHAEENDLLLVGKIKSCDAVTSNKGGGVVGSKNKAKGRKNKNKKYTTKS
eukprot:CAMPEP_0176502192 /NCGR_PEP_ID=MMETSP0200_2-20121128/14614_1 /TAXON_ID=947934 /ORGANISM="Chaetoceros sp., Strain GSL56" /LENGTH=896 /DNA_ID=CAMNT_0017901231 /DNA_START=41 /DNA_END=2731 /DNA_ORIENTATION=+